MQYSTQIEKTMGKEVTHHLNIVIISVKYM